MNKTHDEIIEAAEELQTKEIDADAARALRDIQYSERKKKVDDLKKELFNV